MGELAASGGYYIAAASDYILANAQTTTGSIGVLSIIPVVDGLLDRVGVDIEIVRSGPLKGSGSGLKPLGDVERAVIQQLVDGAYDQFVGIVAEGRHLDPQRVRELADGRVYSGSQALQLGLIDQIGDLPQAIDHAAALAHLEGKPRVIEDRRPGLIEGLLSSRALGSPLAGAATAGLPLDRSAPLQYLYLGTGR
jgi:protease-4